MTPRDHVVPMGVQLAEARSAEARVNELSEAPSAPTPFPFPTANGRINAGLLDYWTANRCAMRGWVIATLLGERLPIEQAYEVGIARAVSEIDRPLAWWEVCLLRECIRDVLHARDAISRREET